MLIRNLVRLPLLVSAVLAALLALGGTAFAASTVHITGGHTALTLDRGTAKVLADNGVSATPFEEARASGRTFTFPITEGRVDAKTLAGTIDHVGGIRFSAGDNKLDVEDFVIDTKKSVLTARVSGTDTRVPLLSLDLSKASIHREHGRVVVGNVRASLTGEAADALNDTFDTDLFTKGLKIGVAKVTAEL